MAKLKTTVTKVSVASYVKAIEDKEKRDDSLKIIELMKAACGHGPKMWGPSIIGFDSYHYKYESGHEGDMPTLAFAPRKAAIVLYFWLTAENKKALLPKFGKHKATKACIYVKRLSDIDMGILKKMIALSLKNNKWKKSPDSSRVNLRAPVTSGRGS